MTFRKPICFCLALLVGLFAGCGGQPAVQTATRTPFTYPTSPPPAASPLPPEVRIGVVYPLTGRLEDNNEWGSEGLPFIHMAEADVNQLPQAISAGVQFRFIVRSSDSTGEGALAAVRDLVENEGVQVIVGIPTSGELTGVMDYVTEHQVAVISSASTGPSPALMMPDTVYRIAPTELYLAGRLADFASDQGYTKAVIIYRRDGWGDRYAAEFAARFAEHGCSSAQVAITPTHPQVGDYAVEVGELSRRAAELGADDRLVVIMAVWEGEDLNILHHAALDPVLSNVRWLSAILYPSLLDGRFANTGLYYPEVPEFAAARQLWGQENHPQTNPLVERLWAGAESELGHQPRYEHVYLYDAVQIAVRAVLVADSQEGRAVAGQIPVAAQTYDTATGVIRFDANGDRISGDLAYYGLYRVGSGYQYWYFAFFYDDGAGGRLELLIPPQPRQIEFCPEC